MKFKLIDTRDEAKGTKSFFWQPESGIEFQAGQYFYYTIPLKYPDPRGTTRHFTNSASPTEGNTLRVTTRIREESGFKKTLNELPIGSEVDGEGPNGTFVLDEKSVKPNIFIAGGIGITPFRSMIKFVIDKKLQIPIYLIYSNSISEEITFKTELEEWSKVSPNFKVEMTISKPEESKETWTGRTGRVDDQMVKELLDMWKLSLNECVFWIAGPPPMIDAMEHVLGKLGITADRIFTEKFTGY